MRIGNIEITRPAYGGLAPTGATEASIWVTITMHYNETKSESITIKSTDDVFDLAYAIGVIKRDTGRF